MTTSTSTKLPVWSLAIGTIQLTFKHFTTILVYAWPWLILLAAISSAINWTYYPWDKSILAGKEGVLFAFMLLPLLWMAVGSLVAVPWHRYLLLDEKPRSVNIAYFAGTGLRYFAIVTFFTFLPVLTGFIPILFLGEFHGEDLQTFTSSDWTRIASISVVAALTIICLSRVALRLPALAISKNDFRFRNSWMTTRGNALRMTAGALLAMFPALAFVYAIEWAVGSSSALSRIGYTVVQNIYDFINMTVGMTSVTFLSLAYRHFFGPVENAAASVPSPRP
jgi:hypothetical protein